MAPNTPIVLHVPHSSRIVPPDVRKSILLIDIELESELIKMTDAYTGELGISESVAQCGIMGYTHQM
jgi:hypothetical protein